MRAGYGSTKGQNRKIRIGSYGQVSVVASVSLFKSVHERTPCLIFCSEYPKIVPQVTKINDELQSYRKKIGPSEM